MLKFQSSPDRMAFIMTTTTNAGKDAGTVNTYTVWSEM